MAGRSSVGPSRNHHRPSSSLHGTGSSRPLSPHFFKIILPATMDAMKLDLPKKFVREFGAELSTNFATLIVPNGRAWQVGLEKVDNKVWFHEGWQDFVDHHSINYGYFLIFRYEGNSHFHVFICDMTSTEIQYPRYEEMNDDPVILEEDQVEMNDDPIILEEDQVDTKKSQGRSMSTAVQAARRFKSKNPSFKFILSKHNVHYHFAAVPAAFANQHFSGHGRKGILIKLMASDQGEQYWDARCFRRDPKHSTMRIGKGWTAFNNDNHLKEGDVCVFELIKKKNVVLKVWIFRAAEYGG